jgi:hypothetical protein
MMFSYRIVPGDGHRGQVLATGSLYIADVASAKLHVQTVVAHGVTAEPGMQVVLLDQLGSEIWRGPYLGRVIGEAN